MSAASDAVRFCLENEIDHLKVALHIAQVRPELFVRASGVDPEALTAALIRADPEGFLEFAEYQKTLNDVVLEVKANSPMPPSNPWMKVFIWFPTRIEEKLCWLSWQERRRSIWRGFGHHEFGTYEYRLRGRHWPWANPAA